MQNTIRILNIFHTLRNLTDEQQEEVLRKICLEGKTEGTLRVENDSHHERDTFTHYKVTEAGLEIRTRHEYNT